MKSPRLHLVVGLLVLLTMAHSALAQHVAPNPRSWAGRPPVGDGECVALVKAAANISTATPAWRPGVAVKGANLREGTAIATFINGRYIGHAALYLGQNAEGIQVVDQWAVRRSRTGAIIRPAQPPHVRPIRWNGSGISDNGMLFYVIL
jgi:hypothetical protein